MRDNVIIVAIQEDPGGFSSITKGFQRAGITNEIKRFESVEEAETFFDSVGSSNGARPGQPYLLLLDANDSNGQAIDFVKKVKKNASLKRMPVLVFSNSESQEDATRWHMLGCSVYLSKPEDDSEMIDAVHKLGLFLGTVEIPQIAAAS